MSIRRLCLVMVLSATACGPIDGLEDDAGGEDSGPRIKDSGVTPPHDAGVIVVDAGMPVVDAGQPPFDAGVPDAGDGLPDPVLFIHGINGSANDYSAMVERLKADGWPADRLMTRTFSDPAQGCNVDNANAIKQWATELMAATRTTRIDLVAHSMGTLSSRRYLKALGGSAVVNTFVSLGGMNHGLGGSVCLGAQLPDNLGGRCTWRELCESMSYVTELNATPATPGPATWVTIAGGADTTVPNASTFLAGAENVVVPGVTHDGASGLQQDPMVYEHVKRVLRYAGH